MSLTVKKVLLLEKKLLIYTNKLIELNKEKDTLEEIIYYRQENDIEKLEQIFSNKELFKYKNMNLKMLKFNLNIIKEDINVVDYELNDKLLKEELEILKENFDISEKEEYIKLTSKENSKFMVGYINKNINMNMVDSLNNNNNEVNKILKVDDKIKWFENLLEADIQKKNSYKSKLQKGQILYYLYNKIRNNTDAKIILMFFISGVLLLTLLNSIGPVGFLMLSMSIPIIISIVILISNIKNKNELEMLYEIEELKEMSLFYEEKCKEKSKYLEKTKETKNVLMSNLTDEQLIKYNNNSKKLNSDEIQKLKDLKNTFVESEHFDVRDVHFTKSKI